MQPLHIGGPAIRRFRARLTEFPEELVHHSNPDDETDSSPVTVSAGDRGLRNATIVGDGCRSSTNALLHAP